MVIVHNNKQIDMKRTFYSFYIIFSSMMCKGQVGINTTNPKSTLDVNGNLIIRDVGEIADLNSNIAILVRDRSSVGDYEIKEINSSFFNGQATAYYATKNGSWSLINLGIGGGWQKINLTGSSDTKFGDPTAFNNGVFTIQRSGLYAVNYEIQFESGINIEAVGGRSLGLLKNTTIWEQKRFDGVRVSLLGITLAAIPLTSTSINTIVPLAAGDSLTFAFNVDGLLNVGLLTNSKLILQIYRISNL